MSEKLIEYFVAPADIPFLQQEIERLLRSYEQPSFAKGERVGCLCLSARTFVRGAGEALPTTKKVKDEEAKKEKPDDDNRGGASRSKPRHSG